VIQDSDRQNVVKWPILGDMPIIGQLFRKSANSRQRNELVILVTPSVVDDASGGVYGYGYRPLTQAAREIVR
jgi:type IV pilus assembly protein PilQ